MTKITTQDIPRIAGWTAEGLLTTEIADRLSVSTKTIERYRVAWGIEIPSRRTHGIKSTYNSGCRCAECSRAHRGWCNKRRAQRREVVEKSGLPLTVQHGYSAAINWGCRCAVCVEAVRVKNVRAYRKRISVDARGSDE